VARIALYDMPGGHSSMLVEPHVQELAVKFQSYLNRAVQASSPGVASIEKTELKPHTRYVRASGVEKR